MSCAPSNRTCRSTRPIRPDRQSHRLRRHITRLAVVVRDRHITREEIIAGHKQRRRARRPAGRRSAVPIHQHDLRPVVRITAQLNLRLVDMHHLAIHPGPYPDHRPGIRSRIHRRLDRRKVRPRRPHRNRLQSLRPGNPTRRHHNHQTPPAKPPHRFTDPPNHLFDTNGPTKTILYLDTTAPYWLGVKLIRTMVRPTF